MAAVDGVDLFYPAQPFGMRQRQDFIIAPAESYRDERYLLV
jgi:hypothetical protein